jgi:DNA-binding response OmpR family regulator
VRPAIALQDDPFLRLTLPQTTFAQVGIDFDQAEDGQQALEMVLPDIHKYTLIIIDNQVPAPSPRGV